MTGNDTVGRVPFLEGLIVVDLAAGMAPALVAKFVAEMGATVVRAEDPAGDPFYDYYPAYKVWHRGATLRRIDTAELHRLLATADVCLIGGEDHPQLTRILDADELATAHPQLIVLEIGGNPHGTDDSRRPSTELLAQARSGLCYEQFSNRPLAMAFQPANYGAALQGLCALLAALYERLRSGRGQVARTSLFEGVLAWEAMYWMDFEHTPRTAFVTPKDPVPLIFRCADGVYVHLVMGSAGSKYKLYRVLGIDDPSVKPEDSGLPDPRNGMRNFYGDVDLLAEHVRRFDSAPLLEALWNAGLVAEPVLQPGACWDHPQVHRNGILTRDADGVRHVGLPFKAGASSASWKEPRVTSALPLAGVKVIDFGAFVAGPLASAILAQLGADVIKVEPLRGEASRAVLLGFMVANRGKRSVAIDLKSPAGTAVARSLAIHADVVTSNFRAGVSKRLGIDPATLHAANPGLVVLESPGYGCDGPLAQRGAFDLVMQALCGHEARAGGQGNEPLWNRTNMVDFAAGMLGAVSVLAALYYRARTLNGAALEVPLLNAGIYLFSELLQKPSGAFVGAPPVNSARTGFRPSEAMYAAQDGWLAIVARDQRAERALAEVLGVNTHVQGEGASWGEREYDVIAQAVSRHTVAELAAELEAAGVWTERCRADMQPNALSDPQLQARGTVRVTQHPRYGRVRQLGNLYTLSRSPLAGDIPLPDVGQHTREVMLAMGHTDDQIDALLREGVIAVAS
jgi:crotonobetainyl-CoA:carnitine CoA-transferase CaiB-like acyl-CoA transferase